MANLVPFGGTPVGADRLRPFDLLGLFASPRPAPSGGSSQDDYDGDVDCDCCRAVLAAERSNEGPPGAPAGHLTDQLHAPRARAASRLSLAVLDELENVNEFWWATEQEVLNGTPASRTRALLSGSEMSRTGSRGHCKREQLIAGARCPIVGRPLVFLRSPRQPSGAFLPLPSHPTYFCANQNKNGKRGRIEEQKKCPVHSGRHFFLTPTPRPARPLATGPFLCSTACAGGRAETFVRVALRSA